MKKQITTLCIIVLCPFSLAGCSQKQKEKEIQKVHRVLPDPEDTAIIKAIPTIRRMIMMVTGRSMIRNSRMLWEMRSTISWQLQDINESKGTVLLTHFSRKMCQENRPF